MSLVFPFDPEHRARVDDPGARLQRSRVPRARARADLRAHVAARRTRRRRCASTGSSSRRRSGTIRSSCCATATRCAASTTSACIAPARSRTGCGKRQHAPVPLPRLDVRARRHAPARAGDGGRRALQPDDDAPRARAGRDVGPARLREPRRQGAAARRGAGGHPATASRPSAASRCATCMRKEWEIACNWKVYVDNYLEGYHLPVVHPGLHKELDYDDYRVEPHRYFSIQHAPLRPRARRQRANATLRSRRDGGRRGGLRLALPEHDAQRLPGADADERRPPARPRPLPRGLRVVRRAIRRRTRRPTREWTQLLAFSDEIQDEDIEICEIVQRNLRSRVVRPRPLLGRARERRAPFPFAAARVPDVTATPRRRGRRPVRRLERSLGVGFGVAVGVGAHDRRGHPALARRGRAAASQSRGSSSARGCSGGVWALLGANAIAELATTVPRSGGQYVFVRRALGPYAGFLVGWNDWLSTTRSVAAIAIVEAEALGALVPRARVAPASLVAEIAVAHHDASC